MIKKIIVGLLAAGVLIGVFVYQQYNKEHRDIAAEQVAITISSVDLFQKYVDDEAAANAVYLDQVIAVTGMVLELSEEDGNQMIVLQANDDFFGVNVYLDSTSSTEGVNPGDMLTIKGQCTGGDGFGVIMAHCTIVN